MLIQGVGIVPFVIMVAIKAIVIVVCQGPSNVIINMLKLVL